MKPALQLPRGPVMVDVAGTALDEDERRMLCHPRVGGVILFARNYASAAQLRRLCAEIHALRSPALLIAVDHEGGRVQRFRSDGFTALPAMRTLGELWSDASEAAVRMARATGYVLAAELLAHGVDLSFAPVLDLDYGCSRAIGNRAFHRDPKVTSRLAHALTEGMAQAGMACVGKHFPGHGFVEADSHHALVRDLRSFDEIWAEDLLPYRGALGSRLGGVMPAHVIYPQVDPNPAGFSRFWLQDVLRGRLGFGGIIFSDDLNMEGAALAGDIVGRARAAHDAGCDMLLVCNRPDLAAELLAQWTPAETPAMRARLDAIAVPAAALCDSAPEPDAFAALRRQPEYLAAHTLLPTRPQDDAGAALTAAHIGEQRIERLSRKA